MNIVVQIEKTIEQYSMISPKEHVLIGLSGGADSVCLSLALKKLSAKYDLTLSAVYIDHGLRPQDMDREIAFCSDFTRQEGIDFYVRHIRASKPEETGGKRQNLHDELRLLRYSEFRVLAFEIGADSIALGHTRDDQAETLLMRLLRGSGSRGLSGIYPVNCGIIRPLLNISRQDIESYLKEQGQQFIEDPSNQKNIYLRNRIRHTVIPVLKQLNPNLSETFAHAADMHREEDELLEILATKEMEKVFVKKTDDTVELRLAPLVNLHIPMKRRVIRRTIGAIADLRGICLNHIDAVIALIDQSGVGACSHLPGGIRAIKGYNTLKLTTSLPKKLSSYALDVPGSLYLSESALTLEASVEQGKVNLQARTDIAVFDFNRIELPLCVRSRKPGDFFFPFGFGKRKKLQDLFVDLKIPREQRDSIPVVTSGNDIIWVAGCRTDARYSVSDSTQRYLVLKLVN